MPHSTNKKLAKSKEADVKPATATGKESKVSPKKDNEKGEAASTVSAAQKNKK